MRCAKGKDIGKANLMWPICMYMLLAWTVAMAVRSTYVDVLKPTKMLNSVGMSSLVHQRIVANHDTYTMADWQDEIGYPWGIGLRFAVILSPCWLTIQSLITAKTVFSHWFRMWDIVNDYW